MRCSGPSAFKCEFLLKGITFSFTRGNPFQNAPTCSPNRPQNESISQSRSANLKEAKTYGWSHRGCDSSQDSSTFLLKNGNSVWLESILSIKRIKVLKGNSRPDSGASVGGARGAWQSGAAHARPRVPQTRGQIQYPFLWPALCNKTVRNTGEAI